MRGTEKSHGILATVGVKTHTYTQTRSVFGKM